MIQTRSLPPLIAFRNLFGGARGAIGCLLLLLGAIVFGVVLPRVNLWEPFLFGPGSNAGRGVITAVEDTQILIGGSRGRKGDPLFRYRFRVEGGTGEGLSYSSGPERRVNEPVVLEIDRSGTARIVGMQLGMLPWAMGWGLLLIPAIGVLLLFFSVRHGLRVNRLLREGGMADGEIVSELQTNVRINNQPVIEYQIEFKTREGRVAQIAAKTHRAELLEAPIRVLYERERPEQGLVVNLMSNRPQFDQMGGLASVSTSIWTLLLPGLTVAVYGLLINRALQ